MQLIGIDAYEADNTVIINHGGSVFVMTSESSLVVRDGLALFTMYSHGEEAFALIDQGIMYIDISQLRHLFNSVDIVFIEQRGYEIRY